MLQENGKNICIFNVYVFTELQSQMSISDSQFINYKKLQ